MESKNQTVLKDTDEYYQQIYDQHFVDLVERYGIIPSKFKEFFFKPREEWLGLTPDSMVKLGKVEAVRDWIIGEIEYPEPCAD